MKKTIGVIFPGYGGQFVTMGKDLYDKSRSVQDLFEQASMCLDVNFVQLCFASSDAEISDIYKGYLSILLFQISMYSQLSQAGLKPDFIAGFGIGEYAASVASGSLSFADALYLLNKYAKFFKEFVELYPDYTVLYLSRGFTKESLEQVIQDLGISSGSIFISAYISEHGFYIAGNKDAIEKIKVYCKEQEIRKVKELSVAYGLHCSLFDSVASMVLPYVFKIDFKPLKFPIITNVDGAYVTSSDALESALMRQINNPILWDEVLQGFIGCEVLLCFGPGKQMFDMVTAKYPEKEIYHIQTVEDLQAIEKLLQNQEEGVLQQAHEIEFGSCHIDQDVVSVHQDLTVADEMNELPTDYDIEEDDEEELI